MSALRDALRDLSEDVFFDLLESDDTYLLVLDVPGVAADSLDIAVEGDRLAIDAQREKNRPGEYQYLEENRSLFFDVDLPLPEDALADEAEATVERGVLELTIPKRSGEETTIDVVERDRDEDDDHDHGEDDEDAAGAASGDRGDGHTTDSESG